MRPGVPRTVRQIIKCVKDPLSIPTFNKLTLQMFARVHLRQSFNALHVVRRGLKSGSVSVTVGDVTYEQPTQLFINNEWVSATGGKEIVSINPTTEEVIATVEAASKEDVDKAVAAARKAYTNVWSHVSGGQRSELLRRIADMMEKHFDTLTAIEAADSGKPRWKNANYDVQQCIDIYRYYAGWADKVEGKLTMDDPKRLMYTRHQPYGVVGQIVPWNFPLAMAAWKIAPAVAAGNVVVLKTAENTPLSMLYLCNIFKEAGTPPGVINVISGYGKEAGDALARHMDVDKIAFTGSTPVGQTIMAAASASNLKAVTLECGGKSPAIVFQDADLEQSARWACRGIMYNMGQVCCATSRVIVHESIYDEFVESLKHSVETMRIVGDPFDKETNHGPQVSKIQFDKVLGYIDIGKKEGARLVMGGERWGNKGYFIKPTIFADVKPDMRIAQEEIFGPVVAVIKFSTEKEAIDIANGTIYGLGAAVFTKDIEKGHRIANMIDSGTVWVNSSADIDYHLPFGGHKMSGIGSELGGYGLESYLLPKSIQLNLGYNL